MKHTKIDVQNEKDFGNLGAQILNGLRVFNGSLEDFFSKKQNIWLGVSISLKPYSAELAKEYLKIIAKYSKAHALVFIGDEIAAINYRVLEGYGYDTSLKKALEKGDLFFEKYKSLIKSLSPEDQKKIKIVRWKDIWTVDLEQAYEVLRSEYLSNSDFRREVEAPIITYLKNSGRTVKESRVSKMAEYILRELPSLLEGVDYQGISYRTLLYPTYGKTSLSEVVTKIQNGVLFGELKKKLFLKGDHILVDSPIPDAGGKGFLSCV